MSRFGSKYTLYNANTGSLIVNTSSSLSDFYSIWNQTNLQQQTTGLNLPTILKELRTIGQTQLDYERSISSVGGQSMIALIVTQMAGVSESDGNFAVEQIEILRENVPDLTLLFWASGTVGRFSRFVKDQKRDLFALMAISSGADSGRDIQTYTKPLIERIQSS